MLHVTLHFRFSLTERSVSSMWQTGTMGIPQGNELGFRFNWNITSNYCLKWPPSQPMIFVMNKITLRISIHVNDWIAERANIAGIACTPIICLQSN